MRSRVRPLRVRPRCLVAPAILSALLGCGLAATPSWAAAPTPMVSAVSTSSDSWVTLPMGDLSDPSNTFWELFHAAPGSSTWSLVTPPGVADNGGLIASVSSGAAVVGVVPSDLLRFSPLAQSANSGTSWVPAFLPGALARLPDALAYDAAAPGGVIAVLGGGRALSAPVGLTAWSPLVTATTLSRVSPGCGVDGLDGATLLPSGAPLIATGCRRGGQVGLFTRTAQTWRSAGLTLGGAFRGAATTVLRVQSTAAATTVLALASRGARRALVALWRSGSAPWSAARPLAIGSGTSDRVDRGECGRQRGGSSEQGWRLTRGRRCHAGGNVEPAAPPPGQNRGAGIARRSAPLGQTRRRCLHGGRRVARSLRVDTVGSRRGAGRSRPAFRWPTARRADHRRGTVTTSIPANDGRAA